MEEAGPSPRLLELYTEACDLARVGESEAAVEKFRWLWEHGSELDPRWPAAQLSFVRTRLRSLSSHPRCRDRICELRQRTQRAQDLGALPSRALEIQTLNEILSEEPR
jgi:hypothetical protein